MPKYVYSTITIQISKNLRLAPTAPIIPLTQTQKSLSLSTKAYFFYSRKVVAERTGLPETLFGAPPA